MTRLDSLTDSENGDDDDFILKVPTERSPLIGSKIVESAHPETPEAASYTDVFLDPKTCILCCTGFFFQYVSFDLPVLKNQCSQNVIIPYLAK